MPSDRPPRPRWVRVVVAGFVAFELTAAAGLVARRAASDAEPRATRAVQHERRHDAAGESLALRATAVEDLLARRARAIRTRDRAAFTGTLDPAQRAFTARQLAMFDALADVPIHTWEYDVDADDDVAAPTRYGTEAWAPRVTLRYRLTGFDAAPAETDQYFTFVRRGDKWLVANDEDFATTGRRTAREVWDFGRVTVVRGERSLVLGHPGTHEFLRDVARQADEAVPRVSAVWGTGWGQRVVVVVPATEDEVGAIVGDDGDLSRVAAVAVAALPGGGRRAVGNRVVVNPANFRRLGTVGRRVVMTHEVTHVATRDVPGTAAPTWLVEGFADYVGYLGSGLTPYAICQELAADVRAGRVPDRLPDDAAFDGGNERLAQAYEGAWLAVRLVAERIGQPGLVAFYRRAATTPLGTALAGATGLTEAEFTRLWRDYVRQTLG